MLICITWIDIRRADFTLLCHVASWCRLYNCSFRLLTSSTYPDICVSIKHIPPTAHLMKFRIRSALYLCRSDTKSFTDDLEKQMWLRKVFLMYNTDSYSRNNLESRRIYSEARQLIDFSTRNQLLSHVSCKHIPVR